MSEILRRWAELRAEEAAENASRERPRAQPPEDEKARLLMLKEAKRAGATLANEGKGGLPGGLVLFVMRRDRFTCKICGRKEWLGVHHVGGIPESEWASNKGHQNKPNNLVTVCQRRPDGTPGCHDKIHEKARAEGNDSGQVTPKGDEGTRRDEGLPPAGGQRTDRL